MVVANILLRTLKIEGEKGSMGTTVGHGLSGPKSKISFYECNISYILERDLG